MWAVRVFLIVTVGGYQDKERQVHLRASAKTLPSKQVIFFRHCVRSTNRQVKGVDGFGFAENFTNRSLPNWQTPERWCTAQGAEMMEHTGKWLAQTRFPSITSKTLQMISDVMNRDATSANHLLQGLAKKNETYDFTVQFLPHLFHSFGHGRTLCTPNSSLVKKESAELLLSTTMPMGVGRLHEHMNTTRYREALRTLETFVGRGKAGPLEDLPVPSVSADGSVKLGGASVMRFFAQNLMYAFASGIPYMSATMEQRYSYVEWVYFYRKVLSQVPAKLAVQRACGILKVIDDLRSPLGPNMMYSGHDGDLDALALAFQLSWEAPPWPGTSPTPPGSALAFTVQPDEVKVEFLYPVFNGSAAIDLRSMATSPAKVDLAAVEERVKKLIRLYAGQSCIDACQGAKSI